MVRKIMEQEEYWDIATVDKIAEEFQIPLLGDMIAKSKKLKVNMNHISGFFEENGQKSHFMPDVQFHPMEDGSGFKLLLFDVHADEKGNTIAEVFPFHKSEEEPGNYKVFLHEDGDIISEEVSFSPSDPDLDDDLEEYPSREVPGYENPFKMLDYNPTLEI